MAPSNTASFYIILAYSIEGCTALSYSRSRAALLLLYFSASALFCVPLWSFKQPLETTPHLQCCYSCLLSFWGWWHQHCTCDFGDILSFFSVGLDEDCHFQVSPQLSDSRTLADCPKSLPALSWVFAVTVFVKGNLLWEFCFLLKVGFQVFFFFFLFCFTEERLCPGSRSAAVTVDLLGPSPIRTQDLSQPEWSLASWSCLLPGPRSGKRHDQNVTRTIHWVGLTSSGLHFTMMEPTVGTFCASISPLPLIPSLSYGCFSLEIILSAVKALSITSSKLGLTQVEMSLNTYVNDSTWRPWHYRNMALI